jgi:hypothetical protein
MTTRPLPPDRPPDSDGQEDELLKDPGRAGTALAGLAGGVLVPDAGAQQHGPVDSTNPIPAAAGSAPQPGGLITINKLGRKQSKLIPAGAGEED